MIHWSGENNILWKTGIKFISTISNIIKFYKRKLFLWRNVIFLQLIRLIVSLSTAIKNISNFCCNKKLLTVQSKCTLVL